MMYCRMRGRNQCNPTEIHMTSLCRFKLLRNALLWVLLMSCNKAQLITEGAPLGKHVDAHVAALFQKGRIFQPVAALLCGGA